MGASTIIPSTLPTAVLPLATLKTIDLQRLQDQDAAEKVRLLEAAKEEGFFYLSFENMSQSSDFFEVIDDIYELERILFGLPVEEKNAFDVDKQSSMKLNGYKPIGRNVGGTKGNRDGFESWAVPKDGVLGLTDTPFSRPACIETEMPVLEAFMKHMQGLTTTIHTALSDMLGLKSPNRLEEFHRTSQASPCILRLLKYHAQPPAERGAVQTPHTDLGSLTLLFTNQPGLQVLPRGSTDDWRFVLPKPRCAIVNVGDALTMMTQGVLQSSLHRVGPMPGMSMPTRFSFAYLQRPEEHTLLQVAGEDVTSGEWLRRKFGMLRKDTFVQGERWVLTGRGTAIPE